MARPETVAKQQPTDFIERIDPGEHFSFLCHRQIGCFTHCCCELELALTPYDVLRLRKATRLHSRELLEKYIISEQHAEEIFPRFYLTMVDDGKASCVFVTPKGCSIYQDRPGACRSYPLGRAASRKNGRIDDFYVLLHEPHCLGFTEHTIQTVSSFSRSQGLEPYNHFNDLLTAITQHEKIQLGQRISGKQRQNYTLALYDIDTFRARLQEGSIPCPVRPPGTIFSNDEELLVYAMEWVKKDLFSTPE